jgi:tight adherence protein B
VTNTIRDRIRLFAEVRVLTAQQRFGSYILTFMPIGMAAAMFFLRPEYMMRLFDPSILCIPVGAVIMVILGNILVRRLAKIEYEEGIMQLFLQISVSFLLGMLDWSFCLGCPLV